MRELLQVVQIIFELQRKKSNEKIARRKISFPTHKTCFFPPLLFELLLLSKLLTFSFLVHFNNLSAIGMSPEVLQITFEH
jgi:hypothetical protein